MTFFNKKEDVIDLQLTQYGKHKLSQGEFKPTYYAFFDDDILYDGNYAGVTEEQSAIRNRIEESVRPKTQYVFEGIETTIKQNNKIIRNELPPDLRGNRYGNWEENIQATQTRNYAMALPLGNSDYMTEKTPAWSVLFLHGQISASQDYIGRTRLTDSLYDISLPTIKIPQLEAKIKYETKAVRSETFQVEGEVEYGPLDDLADTVFEEDHDPLEEETFFDGTRFEVNGSHIILECKEENAPFLKDNFDIEVFEVTSSTGRLGLRKEVLIPLYFQRADRESNIVNNILIDTPPIPLNELAMLEQLPATDSSFVEHYFHINVDREIDSTIMCDLIDVKKDINTQLLDIYECPKKDGRKEAKRAKTRIDVYERPGGVSEEEIEEC